MFLYERAIIPIQKRIRNRKRIELRRKFLDELSENWKDEKNQLTSLVYTTHSLKTDRLYIVLGGETKQKKLLIIAWDIFSFERFQLEIPKKQFLKYIIEPKRKFALVNVLI